MINGSFYNTINLSGIELFDAEISAQTQEDKILIFFKNNSGNYPPSKIHQILIDRKIIHPLTPITSIRRAITNLTKSGKITMTDEMSEGPLGKPEHQWMIKPSILKLFY
jgi:hypothetical protein